MTYLKRTRACIVGKIVDTCVVVTLSTNIIRCSKCNDDAMYGMML